MDLSIKRSVYSIVGVATPESAVATGERYSDARDALEVRDTLSPNWWLARTSSVHHGVPFSFGGREIDYLDPKLKIICGDGQAKSSGSLFHLSFCFRNSTAHGDSRRTNFVAA